MAIDLMGAGEISTEHFRVMASRDEVAIGPIYTEEYGMDRLLSAATLLGVLLAPPTALAGEDYSSLAEGRISGMRSADLETLCRDRDVTKAAYYIRGVLEESLTRENSPTALCPGKRSLIDVRNLICGEVGGTLDDDKEKIPAAVVVTGIAAISMPCDKAED